MKKNLLTLFSILVVASLAISACGAPATEAPVATEAAPVETEAPVATEAPAAGTAACAPNCTYADMTIGFLQTGSEGGWRAANTASFKEARPAFRSPHRRQ
jgi:hypothetical protein